MPIPAGRPGRRPRTTGAGSASGRASRCRPRRRRCPGRRRPSRRTAAGPAAAAGGTATLTWPGRRPCRSATSPLAPAPVCGRAPVPPTSSCQPRRPAEHTGSPTRHMREGQAAPREAASVQQVQRIRTGTLRPRLHSCFSQSKFGGRLPPREAWFTARHCTPVPVQAGAHTVCRTAATQQRSTPAQRCGGGRMVSHLGQAAPRQARRHVARAQRGDRHVRAYEAGAQQAGRDAHRAKDGHLPEAVVVARAVQRKVVVVQPGGRAP